MPGSDGLWILGDFWKKKAVSWDLNLCCIVIFYNYTHIHAEYIFDAVNNRRVKTSLKKICTSHFIVRVQKGLLKVLLWEGVGDWTKTAIYWPPLLWPALCLSRSPDGQPEAWGPRFLLSAGFLYHILSPTGFQNYWGPRGPLLLGGGFLYHILFPTRLISNSLISNFLIPNSIGGPAGPLHWAVAFSATSFFRLLWSPTRLTSSPHWVI